MSFYIKSNDKGVDKKYSPTLKEWDLDIQLIKCEKWIIKNSLKLKGREWILDIGYSDLERGNNVSVCGYTVPLSLMKICVKYKITLWLSSYGQKFEDTVKKIKEIDKL